MDLIAERMGSFDTFPLAFSRDGSLLDPSQLQSLKDRLHANNTRELLVISHGWNNDESEALELYKELVGNLSIAAMSAAGPARSAIDVVLVYWPSKRFADSDLIPGGAASFDSPDVDAVIDAQLIQLIDSFTGHGRDDPQMVAILQRLRTLAPQLDDDVAAVDDFVRLLRSAFAANVNDEEPVLDGSFFETDSTELLTVLGRPFLPRVEAAGGGAGVRDLDEAQAAAGGAAFLGNVFKGLKNGAHNFLNLFTYYEMKERAGRIGGEGLADVLRQLLIQQPAIDFHLCGHSFGARLVTAAVAALQSSDAASPPVRSLTLLQAAFSHFAFSKGFEPGRDGLFRKVLSKRVRGPMLITHTANDKAVGLAYPIASRLRRQVASGIGDANDPYGGLGRNGAQKTPEVDAAQRVMDEDYGNALRAEKIYNLEATKFIKDHGDVRNIHVARTLWAAMCAMP
eukprot:TRINITY_DN24883_c0_g1_i1.p2 TRINITY_DN24883_c0_g1~~TRINITY_DN24883_c0_g1_i1.p2  ORF type:complete len:454 (-),score=72.88 TRINITY_DN24883_c0_g1_i1:325-1686(-)